MISWTENVHILSFWNFERSFIGQHGLALGILTQFIDDHQRALCGNVENTCSLVSMIPAGGFTGDFQSNSATPILTWKSGWPYHLVIITCSKKRCSKKKKCHCRGYIKLVVSQVAPRAFLPWRWRCLMKILLSSAVVDTRDSLWIDEYVCVYIHTYVSMYYIILHIMHKLSSCKFSFTQISNQLRYHMHLKPSLWVACRMHPHGTWDQCFKTSSTNLSPKYRTLLTCENVDQSALTFLSFQTWWSQNMEGQHCDLAWKNWTGCEKCCETAFFVDFIETQIKTCLHLLNTNC